MRHRLKRSRQRLICHGREPGDIQAEGSIAVINGGIFGKEREGEGVKTSRKSFMICPRGPKSHKKGRARLEDSLFLSLSLPHFGTSELSEESNSRKEDSWIRNVLPPLSTPLSWVRVGDGFGVVIESIVVGGDGEVSDRRGPFPRRVGV